MARIGVFAGTAAVLVAAVVLPGASARPTAPTCFFNFPPPTVTGDTTFAVGCSVAVSKISITRTLRITNASKWAIVSGTSLTTGSCTGEHTTTVACSLGSPGLVPGATFLEELGPYAPVGERVLLGFNNIGTGAFIQTLVVPAGPKLTVKTTVTADSSTTAPAGSSFKFSVTVGGGKFYQWQFKLPPGNTVLYETKQPANGLQCGSQAGGVLSCFEQGVKPLPAGTFNFAITLAHPIPQGTVSSCDVFGTGVQEGKCTLQWYQGR
jgi:hypothetical protein